ncbi:MAG: dockerin type I repeat-containing protein [Lachnospira sp.]|nr:dockerin type I repeat-containing protein [Lachnospira sp.]
MTRKKIIVNRVLSAIMALVLAMAYIPMPVAVSAEETVNTNEASMTTAAGQGQEAVTTEYATLAAAVAAANANEGSTITLLKDVSTSERIQITGKDITFELNGKVLTGSNSQSVLKVAATGSITVKSSVEGGAITTASNYIVIDNYGVLVLESGTLENTCIEGGITRSGIDNSGTLIINGANISATSYGIYVRCGKAVINNGDISGDKAIGLNPMVSGHSAELVVEGGKVIGTTYGISAIGALGPVTVTVNGGYIGGGDFALYNSMDSNTTINGGTWKGDSSLIYPYATPEKVTLGEGVVVYDENYDVVEIGSAKGIVYALKEVPQEAMMVSVSSGGNVTKYATLAEAVAAANANEGSTITLLKDVSTSERIQITGTDITLELNGKVLTGNCTETVMRIDSVASLTIKSSVEGGAITTASSYIVIENMGTLVVDSGIISNTAEENGVTRVGIRSCGTLTINDGRISATTEGVVVTKGKATIKDGEIRGETYAVLVDTNGAEYSAELVVDGGSLIGLSYGIYLYNDNETTTITVNDGYISGVDYAIINEGSGDITINGGTMNADPSDVAIFDVEAETGVIMLGDGVVLYNENYDVVDFSNAKGTVYARKDTPEEAKKIMVSAGGNVTKHATLAEALTVANASEGSVITLLDSISIWEKVYFEGKNITLDLNGKVLSGGDGNELLRVTSKGSLTIKSSINGGKITTDDSHRVINNQGTLVVESGTIINTTKISGTTTTAIIGKGVLTVNGGTITGSTSGIQVIGGKATINAGDISGEYGIEVAISDIDGATAALEVNGGIITGTVKAIEAGGVNGEHTVIINNGELIGGECAIRNAVNCKTTINGGMLTGKTVVTTEGENSTVSLGEGVALYNQNGEQVDISSAQGTVVVIKGNVVVTVIRAGAVAGYETLEAAIAAVGQESAVFTVIKDAEITGDITVYEGQEWKVPEGVTLKCTGTITNNGTFTNKGTVGNVTNNGTFTNEGTVEDVINTNELVSENGSSIKGTLTINAASAENITLSLNGCYFPNGLTVSGTIGDKGVTVADVISNKSSVTDSEFNEIAIAEGQTSVSGAVYIQPKKMIKLVDEYGEESLFGSIHEAFEYAYYCYEATITLLQDVTVDRSIYVEVASSGNIVLDLNGKKLTYVKVNEDDYVYEVICADVYAYGKFTIKSSCEGGVIDGSDAGYAFVANGYYNSNIIIESGTIIGGEYAGIENNGLLTVNGGTISGYWAAIDNYGTLFVNGGMFDFTGVDGEYICSTLYNEGTAIVMGGTFKDTNTIWNCGGMFSVYGGTYPNGLGVVEEGVLADVIPEGSGIYTVAGDEKVTLEEEQTSVPGAVYVKANTVVSVTDKDGTVKEFVSLQQAFDYTKNMKEATVKLLDNITVPATTILESTGNIVLDLNGKKITYSGDIEYAIIMNDYEYEELQFTIKSSQEGGTIDAAGTTDAAVRNYSSGLLVIENVTIIGSKYGIYNSEYTVINNGTISAVTRAVYNQDDELIINGGVIEGCVYNREELTINGGTINGKVYSSYSLTINNGTFTMDEQGENIEAYGKLVINGGVFKGENTTICPKYDSDDSVAPYVEISGGEFQNGLYIDSTDAGSTVAIKDVIAADCYVVDSTGEKITYEDSATSIAGAVKVVSSVNNVSLTTKDGKTTYYVKLEQALYEASKNPGSTVKLLSDVTTNITAVTYGGEYTLDINGKKYTFNNNDSDEVIKFYNATVTIKDSVTGGFIDNSTTARDALGNFGGLLTIESGVINGGYSAVWNDGGTVIINGGTFTGVKAAIDNEGDLIINGGTFSYTASEDDYAVIHNDNTVTINGGIFKGAITFKDCVYESEKAPIVVNGGRFEGGIDIYEYYDKGATTIQNLLAKGCAYYREDGTLVTLEENQESIGHTVIVGITELSSNTYPSEFGFTGNAVADPKDYITAEDKLVYEWTDSKENVLDNAPSAAGMYTLKVYAELEGGIKVNLATQTVTIKYLTVKSGSQYSTDDTSRKEFTVTAAEGYVLANAESVNNVVWTDKLTYTKNDAATAKFYVKEVATGYISDVVAEMYTYVATVYGDSNGDGKINIADAVVVKKHIAGMTDTGIDMYNSDVNADGIVDLKDAVKLMKHLAGYTDVILGEAQAG